MHFPERKDTPTVRGIDLIRDQQQQPDMKPFFEGLDVSYKETKNGNIFVTYSRSNHEHKATTERDHHIVAINGGRNPLIGDYCKQIKEVLEKNPTVSSFTVMHYPYSKSMPDGGPIISPRKVIQDLEKVDQTLGFAKGRRLSVFGLCLGADIIAAGLQNGLTNSCTIDDVFMISPGTGFAEGRRFAENRYLPFILKGELGINAYRAIFIVEKKTAREGKHHPIFKYRYQFASAMLTALEKPPEKRTKLQNLAVTALSKIKVTEEMYASYINFLNKNRYINALLPPNIGEVGKTYKKTADELDQMLARPLVTSPKVTYIRSAWAPNGEIIGDKNRKIFVKQMQDFAEKSEHKDIESGHHGATIKNPTPYTEAFNEIISRTES